MKKVLFLMILMLGSAGCSGIIDSFLEGSRDSGNTEQPSDGETGETAENAIRVVPGAVQAVGGTHGIQAKVRYKNVNEATGGGTHGIRASISQISK